MPCFRPFACWRDQSTDLAAAVSGDDGTGGAEHPAMGPIAEGLRLENYRARLRTAEAGLLQREMELQQRASLAGFSGLDDELSGAAGRRGDRYPSWGPPSDSARFEG